MNLFNNVFARWTLLVLLNVIMSILFALDMVTNVPTFMGVMFAIVVFILLYAVIDLILLNKRKESLRRALHGGAIITALSQFYPVFALLAGAMAIDAGATLTGYDIGNASDRNFFSLFMVTVIEGLLLSVIVFIMTFLIWFLMVAKRSLVGSDE